MAVELIRLRRFPMFHTLPDGVLADIAGFSNRCEFARGEVLFQHGDAADVLYLVEYGRVKVYRATAAGREQILHIIEDGQSVAEVAVLAMERFPASAMALAETAAIKVPRTPLLELVSNNTAAARAMLASQAKWLRHLVDLASGLLLDDIKARLSRYLVLFADRRNVPLEDGSRIELDIKKGVIAAQLGTAPETLSRNFSKLEEEGIILREGREIILLDAAALHSLAYPDL
jgi:CRP-like cAMP-binding protein